MRRLLLIVTLSLACALPITLAAPAPALADPPVSGSPTPPPQPEGRLSEQQADGARRAASGYLDHEPVTARLQAAGSEFSPRPAEQSLGITVQRFDQRYHGLPVLGAQVVVRLRGDSVLSATLDAAADLSVDTSGDSAPTPDQAFAVARADLTQGASLEFTDRGLAILPRGGGVLVRHVSVSGVDRTTSRPLQQEVFVASGSPKPVLSYSSILSFGENLPLPHGPASITARGYNGPALTLGAYRDLGRYRLEDTSRHATITTYRTNVDAANLPIDTSGARLVSTSTLPFSSSVSRSGAIDAHWGAARVLDYYARQFGRDSLDGKGMAIRSYVGLTYLGGPMANAAWTGSEMIYGSGDRTYKPFSASLDIVGHEMTHGVIQHTSNLLYYGQSGAVNEAFADYFGNAIGDDTEGIAPTDPRYSLVGEDICRSKSALRCTKFDLARRMKVSGYYQGDSDEQGVHANSPIISTALWGVRLALGGRVADRLAYAAMTQYLTPSSDFLAVRTAMVAAARDQGLGAADVATVAASFDRNGVVDGWDRFRLEPGARVARSGVSYPDALIALQHGVLVTTDMRDGQAVVLVGPASGGATTELSGLTSDAINDIATNGDEVIELGATVDGFHESTTVRVASVRGGPARTLADFTDPDTGVVGVGIGDQVYAWQVRTYGAKGDRDELVVRGSDGHIDRIPAKGGTFGSWSLAGRRLVFTDAKASRLRLFDVDTGTARTLWTLKRKGRFQPRIRDVALSAGRLGVVADLQQGRQTSVLAFDGSGAHREVILGEKGRQARAVTGVGTSDDAITVIDSRHRLSQFGVADHRWTPVTQRKVRFAWAQGSGREVAWLDQQFGNTAIIARIS